MRSAKLFMAWGFGAFGYAAHVPMCELAGIPPLSVVWFGAVQIAFGIIIGLGVTMLGDDDLQNSTESR